VRILARVDRGVMEGVDKLFLVERTVFVGRRPGDKASVRNQDSLESGRASRALYIPSGTYMESDRVVDGEVVCMVVDGEVFRGVEVAAVEVLRFGRVLMT
jgi:hypothetical protein